MNYINENLKFDGRSFSGTDVWYSMKFDQLTAYNLGDLYW